MKWIFYPICTLFLSLMPLSPPSFCSLQRGAATGFLPHSPFLPVLFIFTITSDLCVLHGISGHHFTCHHEDFMRMWVKCSLHFTKSPVSFSYNMILSSKTVLQTHDYVSWKAGGEWIRGQSVMQFCYDNFSSLNDAYFRNTNDQISKLGWETPLGVFSPDTSCGAKVGFSHF